MSVGLRYRLAGGQWHRGGLGWDHRHKRKVHDDSAAGAHVARGRPQRLWLAGILVRQRWNCRTWGLRAPMSGAVVLSVGTLPDGALFGRHLVEPDAGSFGPAWRHAWLCGSQIQALAQQPARRCCGDWHRWRVWSGRSRDGGERWAADRAGLWHALAGRRGRRAGRCVGDAAGADEQEILALAECPALPGAHNAENAAAPRRPRSILA